MKSDSIEPVCVGRDLDERALRRVSSQS